MPVVVRNEADLGARAEHLRGAGVGFDDLIYLSCDVGVGGGIITGGRPLVGAAGLRRRGRPLPGQSRTAGRVAAARAAAGRPRSASARCCATRAATPTAARARWTRVLRAAEAGELGPERPHSTLGRWLGIGIAGLVNVFDPQVVVLGGLFGRMAPCHVPMVPSWTRAPWPSSREPVGSSRPRSGIDAPVLGAAERAFEPLLADPASLGAQHRRAAGSRHGPR